MFVGREKGVGNFALSGFKHALLLLGLPLPCRTHKHIYNVYTHALCVDQYTKIFKKLIIIIETERICYKHFKGSPKLGKIKKNLSSRFGKKSRGKEIVV